VEVVTQTTEATDRSMEDRRLDQEAVARLAYYCWEERGYPNDSPDADWFQPEAELRIRLAPLND
jgi:hypothetical protein